MSRCSLTYITSPTADHGGRSITPLPAQRSVWGAAGHSLLAGAGVLGLALALVSSGARAESLKLRIIHTNDFHAHIEQTTGDGGRCRTEDAAANICYGGIARMVAKAKALRDEVQNGAVLTLDSGDRFQGTLYYLDYRAEPLVRMVKEMGYSAVALGNHEFDDGEDVLKAFLCGVQDGTTLPVLSASVKVLPESALAKPCPGKNAAPSLRPSARLLVGPENTPVGLIGVTTPSIVGALAKKRYVGRIEALTKNDMFAAVAAEIEALHKDGIRRIIVTSHLGLAEDIELAKTVPGISIIIGAHTHTLVGGNNVPDSVGAIIANDTSIRQCGTEQGPVWVRVPASQDQPLDADKVCTLPPGSAGRPAAEGERWVPIVQAYFAGIYLGVVDVTIDESGEVRAASGTPVLLKDQLTPEQKRVETDAFGVMKQALDAKYGEHITYLPVALNGGTPCRRAECNLGDVMTDSMAWQVAETRRLGQGGSAGADADTNTSTGTNVIAITNSGGIRTSLRKGEINKGDVMEVMPFQNKLVTVLANGDEVTAALNGTLKGTRNPNKASGEFPQIAGIRMVLDKSITREIDYVVAGVPTLDDGSGQALSPSRDYLVVSTDYAASTLFPGKTQSPLQVIDSAALMAYLKVAPEQALPAAPVGRISFVPGAQLDLNGETADDEK